MEGRGKDKEVAVRRKKARKRFRLLIRMVIFNKHWLKDLEERKISTNVKRNIAILVRKERKIGLLTMAEKALIRVPHELRTIEERKRMVSLVSSLHCFAAIPPKLRARMVPHIYFIILKPGLVISYQGCIPMAIYFILTGEVEISYKVWNPFREKYDDIVDMIAGSGECIGDIEMIDGRRRMHKMTCASEVELLCLDGEDFNQVLRPYMTEKWNEKKEAIALFDYFENFNEAQIIALCKICSLKQFQPLENIYYEDKGLLTHVHFVISGQCMILQCLKMKMKMKNRMKSYELVDIKKDGGDMFFTDQNITKFDLIRKLRQGQKLERGEDITSDSVYTQKSTDSNKEDVDEDVPGLKVEQKRGYEYYGVLCGLEKPNEEENKEKVKEDEKEEKIAKHNKSKTDAKKKRKEKKPKKSKMKMKMKKAFSEQEFYEEYEYEDEDVDDDDEEETEEFSEDTENYEENSIGNNSIEEAASINRRRSSKKSLSEEAETYSSNSKSSSAKGHSSAETPDESTKIENHFIDVGTLSFGAIFGLGEKLEHRVIMARTTVQCLMVPRFWLLEKPQNPGNVWQRLRIYLDSTIPSRDVLFKDFLATMRWRHLRHDIIDKCLEPKAIGNPTKIQDIPIICRIVEASDDVQ